MDQRINFHGGLVDEPEIRAGFIGCGSHSFRNIYPTFQFAPVNLVATCDLKIDKARAFAKKFGATAAYSDHREMIRQEKLDAVFIVTGWDDRGHPLYPPLVHDCLEAGLHVWFEKPPAYSCAELEPLRELARKNDRNVLVGLKKMFFPANEKAKELMTAPAFGSVELALLQYPQHIPTREQFAIYNTKPNHEVASFLDHLCHPAALLVYLLGMPKTMYYERSSRTGAGNVMFGYGDGGPVASLALTAGSSLNGGMERTTLISSTGQHIVVDNNHHVSLHRTPPNLGYGNNPNFFMGTANEATAVWEPEFSLGQLYNKGLFLLGYYGEVNEFARSILDQRPVAKGTLDHAWQVTRLFEAFFEGPNKVITL